MMIISIWIYIHICNCIMYIKIAWRACDIVILWYISTCFKVYCPWPGYLEGGKVNIISTSNIIIIVVTKYTTIKCKVISIKNTQKKKIAILKVLLVGNMGLYDYRPYVKRIKNDRQIIFVCDKVHRRLMIQQCFFWVWNNPSLHDD